MDAHYSGRSAQTRNRRWGFVIAAAQLLPLVHHVLYLNNTAQAGTGTEIKPSSPAGGIDEPPEPGEIPAAGDVLTPSQRENCRRWAQLTWQSIERMTRECALPADGLERVTRENGESRWQVRPFTSPSNIGAYLWSTSGAKELGLISPDDAARRIAAVLERLEVMKRHRGHYLNWYSTADAKPLAQWPETQKPIVDYLSSVDVAWLEVGLRTAESAFPELADRCRRIYGGYDYELFAAAEGDAEPGPLVGFYPQSNKGHQVRYSLLNTEARVITYLEIMRGSRSKDDLLRLWLTLPQEMTQQQKPNCREIDTGNRRIIAAAYEVSGKRLVPSWGGSMFEALMVPLFFAEDEWSCRSWRRNHERYVDHQIRYAAETLQTPFWGFSPCMTPNGRYQEMGVIDIGCFPERYCAWQLGDQTRAPVVTPHAAFLALRYRRQASFEMLCKLEQTFGCVSPMGFADSIDVRNRQAADYVLMLDQAMIMASLTNLLADDFHRRVFSRGDEAKRLQEAVAELVFGLD